MADTETKLLRLKHKIDEAKTEKAQLEGKLETLMSQLEKDFGCATVEDAQDRLEDMNAEIKELTKEIEEGVANLQDKYGDLLC